MSLGGMNTSLATVGVAPITAVQEMESYLLNSVRIDYRLFETYNCFYNSSRRSGSMDVIDLGSDGSKFTYTKVSDAADINYGIINDSNASLTLSNMSITTFVGDQDPLVSPQEMLYWANYTTTNFAPAVSVNGSVIRDHNPPTFVVAASGDSSSNLTNHHFVFPKAGHFYFMNSSTGSNGDSDIIISNNGVKNQHILIEHIISVCNLYVS